MSRLFIVITLALSLLQCQRHQRDVSVENVRWKLVEIDGQPVAVPAGGSEVFMKLVREDGERKLQGFAGCNSLGGTYKIDGDAITFEAITTRMFCELQMETEKKFTDVLMSANRHVRRGDVLEVYADDRLLGKFEATPEDGAGQPAPDVKSEGTGLR